MGKKASLPTNTPSFGSGQATDNDYAEFQLWEKLKQICGLLCFIKEAVECPQPISVETGKTTPDGRPVILIMRVAKDGTLTCDAMAINPVTSKPEPYEGECVTPRPPLVPTGCTFGVESEEYCGQEVWTQNPGGGCFAYDATQKDFIEVIPQAVSLIQPKPAETITLTRSFTCEIAAIDGSIKIDNAYVFEQLAGAQIAGCYAADDPMTVTLHEFEATLAGLGDQTTDGFEATSCQAVSTDLETGKSKDIEPSGSIAYENAPGYSVPQFCVELSTGSVMQLCGQVSIVIDKKTNQPVPVPVTETNKQLRNI